MVKYKEDCVKGGAKMSENKGNVLLNSINSPSDVKALDEKKLPQLCSEIREFLVEKVSENTDLAENS